MRPFDPVHGIDYLIDYYALLGVNRNADGQQIQSAFREKMRGYHPDVLARAAPEFKTQAAAKTRIFYRAYETLTDPEKKAPYDEKLKSFDPRLVSSTGEALIDLKKKRIDADFLIGGTKWGQKDFVLEQISTMVGFDENGFRIIEQQFKKAESPPTELRKAYQQALQ